MRFCRNQFLSSLYICVETKWKKCWTECLRYVKSLNHCQCQMHVPLCLTYWMWCCIYDGMYVILHLYVWLNNFSLFASDMLWNVACYVECILLCLCACIGNDTGSYRTPLIIVLISFQIRKQHVHCAFASLLAIFMVTWLFASYGLFIQQRRPHAGLFVP